MAFQMRALRDALESAGAMPDTANRAAEEVATFESRIGGIEGRVNTLTWMVSIAMTLIMFALAGELAIWSKVSELSSRVAEQSAVLVDHSSKLADLTAKLTEQSAKLDEILAKLH